MKFKQIYTLYNPQGYSELHEGEKKIPTTIWNAKKEEFVGITEKIKVHKWKWIDHDPINIDGSAYNGNDAALIPALIFCLIIVIFGIVSIF